MLGKKLIGGTRFTHHPEEGLPGRGRISSMCPTKEKWMGKESVVYIHNGMSPSHKEELQTTKLS